MEVFQREMYIEVFGNVPIYFGIGIQIVTALILGGLVGFDREIKMKAAGLKTNILICIGATLYTTISLINLPNAIGLVDPNRVAAQIVSGIGFLGAGAIIQGRGNVTGLTTAATIWVVAAIGFTIGVGYPLVATLFSITVLVVLRLLAPIHKFIERESEHKDFHIEVLSIGTVKRMASKMFLGENIELEELYEEEPREGKKLLHIFLTGHPRAIERISQELHSIMKVEKVSYRQVESASDMYEMINE
ncbi:MAG: hypothetical protein CME64_13445 [Halobacteriovoraceae bacterium]|nr:hypothetical protein [Halobacteriovoraceae bacterium]|tara:strand:+ start:5800 stop:6540 length:741 start_codon:yes stop_codon:yes gene_type:complete